MRTIIIFDHFGEYEICFFVVHGDYSHLNRIYINGDCDDALMDELTELIYFDGEYAQPALTEFPVDVLRHKPDTKVITCGMIY